VWGIADAFSLMTTLPLPREVHSDSLGRAAARWFWLVGIVLGSIAGGASIGLSWLLPAPGAAAVVVLLWIILTGGLHMDGLADTADAAFASVPRARRLEILSDVHHGSFAAVAIAVVVLAKWAGLVSFSSHQMAAAVVIAAVGSRAALAPVLWAFEPARATGMAAAMKPGASMPVVAVSICVALGAGFVCLGLAGVMLASGTVIAALAMGAWLSGRFGGMTGDACGAIVETTEALSLLAAAALFEHGWVTAFSYGLPR
jgi:adenosylcobinamide-GDP ribazoletransferase